MHKISLSIFDKEISFYFLIIKSLKITGKNEKSKIVSQMSRAMDHLERRGLENGQVLIEIADVDDGRWRLRSIFRGADATARHQRHNRFYSRNGESGSTKESVLTGQESVTDVFP